MSSGRGWVVLAALTAACTLRPALKPASTSNLTVRVVDRVLLAHQLGSGPSNKMGRDGSGDASLCYALSVPRLDASRVDWQPLKDRRRGESGYSVSVPTGTFDLVIASCSRPSIPLWFARGMQYSGGEIRIEEEHVLRARAMQLLSEVPDGASASENAALAQDLLARALERRDSPQNRAALATAFEAHGDRASALKERQRAAELAGDHDAPYDRESSDTPRAGWLRHEYAFALEVEGKDAHDAYERARVAYDRIIAECEPSPTPQDLVERGIIQSRLGRHAEAKRDFERVIESRDERANERLLEYVTVNGADFDLARRAYEKTQASLSAHAEYLALSLFAMARRLHDQTGAALFQSALPCPRSRPEGADECCLLEVGSASRVEADAGALPPSKGDAKLLPYALADVYRRTGQWRCAWQAAGSSTLLRFDAHYYAALLFRADGEPAKALEEVGQIDLRRTDSPRHRMALDLRSALAREMGP